jgi:hypothetical protein
MPVESVLAQTEPSAAVQPGPWALRPMAQPLASSQELRKAARQAAWEQQEWAQRLASLKQAPVHAQVPEQAQQGEQLVEPVAQHSEQAEQQVWQRLAQQVQRREPPQRAQAPLPDASAQLWPRLPWLLFQPWLWLPPPPQLPPGPTAFCELFPRRLREWSSSASSSRLLHTPAKGQ